MDGGTVRRWAVTAARALDAARAPIDRLNVFPVPDGDTGTNLALTVAEGAEHLQEHLGAHDDGAAAVAGAFARGALLGARGNSGVIVSQYLRGFARGLAADHAAGPAGPAETAGPDGSAATLARALDEAQRAARAAVARPVEGTILTAATAAARAADDAVRAGADERATVTAAVAGARTALARTPQTLEVLRAAGVVDAGATGLVVLLGALAEVLGEPVTTATSTLRTVAAEARAAGLGDHGPVRGPDGPSPDAPAHRLDDGEFEVMYVVEPSEHDGDGPGPGGLPGLGDRSGAGGLRAGLPARLEAVGTSVAVVGGADGWHVHVHTDDPAAAVAAGAGGVRSQVVVRRLVPAGGTVRVVAGTTAPGLVPDLVRGGALVLLRAERPPTARDLRRAVLDAGPPPVVVLPGSAATLRTAQGALAGADGVVVLDAADDARVVVALAAAAGAAPDADPLAAMRAALAGVRTTAVDRPDVGAVLAAARRLLDDGGDLVTVLVGAALERVAPAGVVLGALTAGLAGDHPGAEVVVLPAGQTTSAAVLAVEDA